MAGKRRFQHRVVALLLEAGFLQRGAQRDVDGAAAAIAGDDLALEVFDLVDAAVLADIEAGAVVAGDAVLEFVGDDANVVEPGILDCERERRIGEVGDFELVIGDRRDHLRRALIAHRFDRVGLAHVPGEVLLLQHDRGPVRHRRHPRHADLDRLLLCARGADARRQRHTQPASWFSGIAFSPPNPSCHFKVGQVRCGWWALSRTQPGLGKASARPCSAPAPPGARSGAGGAAPPSA